MIRKITIVKVGGAVVEDEAQLSRLLQDFCAIDGPKILVHGGGRRATKIAERLNIETKMVNGRRITDAEMLEVVTMVYGGLVNKNVVARLQALGCDTMASETAKAMAAVGFDVTLIYAFEKPGVLRNPDDDNSVIATINHADFEVYKADGTISGGMLPKIENALAATDAGVKRVIITQATAIDGLHGTVISS